MQSNRFHTLSDWIIAISVGTLLNIGVFFSMLFLGKPYSSFSPSSITVELIPWQTAEKTQQIKPASTNRTTKVQPATKSKKAINTSKQPKSPIKQLALLKELDSENTTNASPSLGTTIHQTDQNGENTHKSTQILKLASPPQFEFQVEPNYPFLMRFQGRMGKVKLAVIIDAQGKVEQVTVLKSAGPSFDDAAKDALLASTFIPQKRNGRPVSNSFVIPIEFKLE